MAWSGMARRGKTFLGLARLPKRGGSWQDSARHGGARRVQTRLGLARLPWVRLRMAWRVWARHGQAGHGSVGQVMARQSQCDQILQMLRVGPATTAQIIQECPGIVHSRICELRSRGYGIQCDRLPGVGAASFRYRLLSEPDTPANAGLPPGSAGSVSGSESSGGVGDLAVTGSAEQPRSMDQVKPAISPRGASGQLAGDPCAPAAQLSYPLPAQLSLEVAA